MKITGKYYNITKIFKHFFQLNLLHELQVSFDFFSHLSDAAFSTCHKLTKFNPFRSYIGPCPKWFLLRLFTRCRSLSDAFPHVVQTLANR
jgi:hypothetical protein